MVGRDLVDKRYVLEHRKCWDQIIRLEDEAYLGSSVVSELVVCKCGYVRAIHDYLAARWVIQAAEQVEESALSSAGWAEYYDELAVFKFKIDIGKRVLYMLSCHIGSCYIFKFNDFHFLVYSIDY